MDIDARLTFRKGNSICEFRTIREDDVTQDYVDGLAKERQYIEHVPENGSIGKQKTYVRNILASANDCIFGLFVDSRLVGTAGAQSVQGRVPTSIGILLFDRRIRGLGYGKILVWASCFLLRRALGRKSFTAGMKKANVASYKSFISSGFVVSSEDEENYTVSLDIAELRRPDDIFRIEVARSDGE